MTRISIHQLIKNGQEKHFEQPVFLPQFGRTSSQEYWEASTGWLVQISLWQSLMVSRLAGLGFNSPESRCVRPKRRLNIIEALSITFGHFHMCKYHENSYNIWLNNMCTNVSPTIRKYKHAVKTLKFCEESLFLSLEMNYNMKILTKHKTWIDDFTVHINQMNLDKYFCPPLETWNGGFSCPLMVSSTSKKGFSP